MPNNLEVKNSSILVTQYIARQPIFDGDKSIFAYELLYRDSVNMPFLREQPTGRPLGDFFLMR